jgi:hypothetical protein
MLYLKLYETFNVEDFYIKLNSEEADNIIKNQSDILSQPDESIYRRLSKFIKSLPSHSNFLLKKNQSLNNRLGLGDILCIGLDHTGYTPPFTGLTTSEFGIYSMDDEYYFVSYYTWNDRSGSSYTKFYKCDQIDGLIMLLKHKIF